MDQRVSVITLGVRDLPRAKSFYDALGWRDEGDPASLVRYNLPGLAFALYAWDALAEDVQVPATGEGFRGITLAYCVRSREDVADVLAEAERAGGTIVKPAQDVFWGGHSGYFADLDGHLWEVAWNPHSPVGDDGAFQWGGA